MNVIDEVKKLEAFHFSASLIGFVGVVSPGLLILFLFKRDLFISLDLIKLILLSISLSLPITFLNFILWSMISGDSEDSKNDIAINLMLALVTSSAIFYLPLAVTFLWGLSLHAYLWVLVAIEGILVLTAALIAIVDSRRKQT